MHASAALAGRRRVRLAGLALAAAAAACACGGGMFVAVHDGDDEAHVAVAASVGAARAGQTVRLSASASDDFGIARVEFFRIDGDGHSVRLGDDAATPYEWDAVMPVTSAPKVEFFARAVDVFNQVADSTPVSVLVLR